MSTLDGSAPFRVKGRPSKNTILFVFGVEIATQAYDVSTSHWDSHVVFHVMTYDGQHITFLQGGLKCSKNVFSSRRECEVARLEINPRSVAPEDKRDDVHVEKDKHPVVPFIPLLVAKRSSDGWKSGKPCRVWLHDFERNVSKRTSLVGLREVRREGSSMTNDRDGK